MQIAQQIQVYDVGDRPRLWAVFGSLVTRLAQGAYAGAVAVSVLDAVSYEAGDVVMLGPLGRDREVLTVASITGNQITFTSPLIYSHPREDQLWKLSDPTAVTITIQDPDDVEVEYTGEVTRFGLGRFYLDMPPLDMPGAWHYHTAGAGAVVAAGEGTFTVRASEFD